MTTLNPGSTGRKAAAYPLTAPDRIGVSINQAALIAGLGRSSIYTLINAGEIESTRIGGRRIVILESLRKRLLGPASEGAE
jgi:predicted DNA-binding transcriptional regulator AlpA